MRLIRNVIFALAFFFLSSNSGITVCAGLAIQARFFFYQTARFIRQTLDQHSRDPPELLQRQGGNHPIRMEDPPDSGLAIRAR